MKLQDAIKKAIDTRNVLKLQHPEFDDIVLKIDPEFQIIYSKNIETGSQGQFRAAFNDFLIDFKEIEEEPKIKASLIESGRFFIFETNHHLTPFVLKLGESWFFKDKTGWEPFDCSEYLENACMEAIK